MKVAILGATSHIAKNLIFYFLKDSQYELFLFARNKNAVHEFIESNDGISVHHILGFEEFSSRNYDAVINCVGIADPYKQRDAGVELFRLTEHYDNLVIDYLACHENTLYINYSSGAVYGSTFNSCAKEDSIASLAVNNITFTNFYQIAKLNSEAKHRAMANRNIIDLRVFGFFSRFVNLHSGFLLCEMVNCVKNHNIFLTNKEDIIRDYVAPTDLYALIVLCLKKKEINCAVDVYSAKQVHKKELIELFVNVFGLVIEINEKSYTSTTGDKLCYYSKRNSAANIFGYSPLYTSIDSIKNETNLILN